MTYDDVIRGLVKNNSVSQIRFLYYDSCTLQEINWQNKKEFLRQLKIWTTSFPAENKNLLPLKAEKIPKFCLKKFFKKTKVLGLHSSLIDKRGEIRYWLMLDLEAKPNPENLDKIKLYLSGLLSLLKTKTGGYILETDNSYHFIGKKFADGHTFRRFLWNIIKSNGGSGLADTGFCGHTLAKNLDVCLRIQKRKNGKSLKVAAEI